MGDFWVKLALADEGEAKKLIDRAAAARNPFDEKYSRVEDKNWESCTQALNAIRVNALMGR